ncbi:hypothetical protein SLEP1_g55341 [Rubroshorea leprosula]|uniref:Uncharacterized protein n=1 Tax=Rubroshorea leprosula TaxID=152421 RepID=A0AAV5MJA0_9ROSI|nr:hypothetical protein SLEP1_g55341 [Rubroshorea leprosula]
MARAEIQIPVTEDENENLMRLEEGPLTPNQPLDEIEITDDELKKLKSLREADSSKKLLKIQKVPNILCSCYGKKDCKRYFKPTSVAIGPLNHQRETDKDSRMERGEKCKQKLAAMFIKDGKEVDFYKNVKKKINSLKNCYNFKEIQKWSDEELAWMFLVDGCALLQFIALDVSNRWEFFSDNDPVSIEKVDFFLLENQLPYQLLQILIDSFAEFPRGGFGRKPNPKQFCKDLINDLINEFINRSFFSLSPQEKHQTGIDYFQPPPPHLLDLLRRRLTIEYSQPVSCLDSLRRRLTTDYNFQPLRRPMGETGEKQEGTKKDGFWETLTDDKSCYTSSVECTKKKGESCSVHNKSKHWPSIRNVKELKEKGIRFKAREKGGAITDIDFKDRYCMATLTLAPLFLHNTTVPLLLNLIAYELCPDFKETCKITSHLSFFDSLIDNGEDVKGLRDAGVLHHGLGSDEDVAELFNKMSGILVPNLKIDSELRSTIHYYCSNKLYLSSLCANIQVKLTHTYFRSPWSYLVFLGAIAGLIMTGMQTYSSFHEDRPSY